MKTHSSASDDGVKLPQPDGAPNPGTTRVRVVPTGVLVSAVVIVAAVLSSEDLGCL